MTFSCRFRRTEWILGLILLIACIEMVVYTVFGTARPQSPREQPAMTMEQARHYIRDTGNLLIIDVRSRKEFFRGHLDHALNIPIHSFPHLVKTIPKDFPVLLIVLRATGLCKPISCFGVFAPISRVSGTWPVNSSLLRSASLPVVPLFPFR